jgi:hypothetical protein
MRRAPSPLLTSINILRKWLSADLLSSKGWNLRVDCKSFRHHIPRPIRLNPSHSQTGAHGRDEDIGYHSESVANYVVGTLMETHACNINRLKAR